LVDMLPTMHIRALKSRGGVVFYSVMRFLTDVWDGQEKEQVKGNVVAIV